MKYKKAQEILTLNIEVRVLLETELMLLKKRTAIETKIAKLEKKEKDGNERVQS